MPDLSKLVASRAKLDADLDKLVAVGGTPDQTSVDQVQQALDAIDSAVVSLVPSTAPTLDYSGLDAKMTTLAAKVAAVKAPGSAVVTQAAVDALTAAVDSAVKAFPA